MFAITTRNYIRSRRYVPQMIIAWLKVRRQLYQTPGMLRYTTGIANLTDFYTCTLWDTEMEMFAFMSSGAHRDMMWNFSRWSEAFWAMRWDATADELGCWRMSNQTDEGRFACIPNLSPDASISKSNRDSPVISYLHKKGIIPESELSEAKPDMAASTAVLARIPVISPASVLRLRKITQPWCNGNPDLLRLSLSIGIKECFLIVIWWPGALEDARKLMATLVHHFPRGWTMRFRGHDFEVGHWDDLRLREIEPPGLVSII